ncbi:hypothetical protein ACF09H_33410 [Streptomyces sp. NPDC014983]|uniref:hypothetical protein n=1 Tax=Streptomyces sp. NPDC014983 TaxID=3364933 RepID=UPI0036FB2DAC
MQDRRLHGGLGAVVGLASAVLAAMVLGRAWDACDAGVNSAADSGFLLYLFIPGLWVVLLLCWAAVGALPGNRPLPRFLARAVVFLAVLWCALSLFWGGRTYDCPGGVPPWWPGLLPAPGF